MEVGEENRTLSKALTNNNKTPFPCFANLCSHTEIIRQPFSLLLYSVIGEKCVSYIEVDSLAECVRACLFSPVPCCVH